MKKQGILVFLCIAIMGMILIGCSQEKTEDSNDGKAKVEEMTGMEQSTESSDEEGDKSNSDDENITIGFVQAGEESDWRTAMTASMNDTFRVANGYTLLLEDAGEDLDKQFAIIRKLIEKKVDYMVISTLLQGDVAENESDKEQRQQIQQQWEEVLWDVKEAEIPVILMGNEITISDENLYTAWVGSDYLQEGYDAADYLQDCLETLGKGKEDVQIAWVANSLDTIAKMKRLEGFLEYSDLIGINHWNFFNYEGKTKWDSVSGANNSHLVMSSKTLNNILAKDQEIDVIICDHDQIALEAIAEAEKAGKNCGFDSDSDIVVISFGASKAGLEEVINGRIYAEIECSPLYGSYVETMIKRLRLGDEIDKKQYLLEEVFTAENAAEAIAQKMY